MLRQSLVRCGFLLFAAIGISGPVNAASNQSPLRWPIEKLRAALAKELRCTWEYTYKNEEEMCRAYKPPQGRAEIWHKREKDVVLQFDPDLTNSRLSNPSDGTEIEVEPAAVQQNDVVNAMTTLFPDWKESRERVQGAIGCAGNHTQTTIRINDTTIWVRQFYPPTGGGAYANWSNPARFYLTTRKDMYRHVEGFHPDNMTCNPLARNEGK